MKEVLPFVTVIMPVRNEETHIRCSLEAVLTQDYPRDRLEVLVVDGQSSDCTREILEDYQKGHENLRVLTNPRRIVPTSLNLALQQARGDIVVRVDGHCQIAPDYIRQCVQALEDEGIECVGGPIETVGETYTARVIACAMSSNFGVGGSAFRTIKDRRVWTDTVPFPAYLRSAVRRIGLFDEELVRNQDDEYNLRLLSQGGRILQVPEIRSRYFSRASLQSLWKQYFQYGYWKVRVMQKHPRRMRLRHFIPSAFVTVLGGLGALALWSAPARLLLGAVLIAYFVTALAASLVTANREDWRYLPLLPVIYLILHLSYGLGFLYGLVRFVRRWGDRRGQVPALQEQRIRVSRFPSSSD